MDFALKAPGEESDMDIVTGRGKIVGLKKILDESGVEYSFDVKNGAHDWGVWRDAFTTFAKDYLWDAETDQSPDRNQMAVALCVVLVLFGGSIMYMTHKRKIC